MTHTASWLASQAASAANTSERTEMLWAIADTAGKVELVRYATLAEPRRAWVREHGPTVVKAAYVARTDTPVSEVAQMIEHSVPVSVVTAAVRAGKVDKRVLELLVKRGHAKTSMLAALNTSVSVIREHPQQWWAAVELGWNGGEPKTNKVHELIERAGSAVLCDPELVNLEFAATRAVRTLRGKVWDSPHGLQWAMSCPDGVNTLAHVTDDTKRTLFHPGVSEWASGVEASKRSLRIAAALESENSWQEYLTRQHAKETAPAPTWSCHDQILSSVKAQRWRGAEVVSAAAATVSVWDPVEDVVSGAIPVRYAEAAIKARPGSWLKLAQFFAYTDLTSADVREVASALAACPDKVRQHPDVVAMATKAVVKGTWMGSYYKQTQDINQCNAGAVYAPMLTTDKVPTVVWEYVLDQASMWANPGAGWEFFAAQLPTWEGSVESLCATTSSVV